jgi:hypothetical protein
VVRVVHETVVRSGREWCRVAEVLVEARGLAAACLGDRVQKNADGSVDLYMGPRALAGKESNWILTDPARKFELMVRLYGPTKAFLDKQWKLMDVEQVQ